MIVGHQKPFQEIMESIEGYKKVLVLGCGTCVSVCLTGGDREAVALSRELSIANRDKEPKPVFEVNTIERQCEKDLIKEFLEVPEDTEAILSLACGAGVQTVADVFRGLPVIPALNTTFLGALDEPGIWNEKCLGCGDCMLALTGGICPIARCAKHLLNGPCGGSSKGKCEISPIVGRDIDCAWQLIIDRLKEMGKLENYMKIRLPRDWSTETGKGPRVLLHYGKEVLYSPDGAPSSS
ncbi:MAG: methylenetetrahydrofolate reductase C-terminal domain-containing protein [Deltaproteobacteria bacterium]|nr:methylenetetrahydrofolate reductase C-terminal domain-containing protein [Deltaproteobacteria bacterium]